LRNSGFEEAAKTTAANAAASIMIRSADSISTSAICELGVANKDVFVIPYTGQACSGFFATNQSTIVSKPVYLEYCFINNEE
jgi:flavoprotein